LEKRIKNAEELKNKGNDHFQKFEYGEAIDCYTGAIEQLPKKHPFSAILFANRAAGYIQVEQFQNSIDDCTKSIEIDPNYVKALFRRAASYKQLEEYAKSLVDYQKILQLQPDHLNAQRAVIDLPPLIKQKEEKEREKMMGDLKDLGNKFLGFFNLSLNNFNVQQDPATGNYSVQFQQNK